MYLIVGLGNPGEKHYRTRHNLGFRVIDELAQRLKIRLTTGKGEYLIGEAAYQKAKLLLAKPSTFMNLSGIAVLELVNRYKPSPSELLVICDDVYLPLGRVRLRRRGSDGGHNGLASIIQRLGSMEFPRLRIGVGNPPPGVDLTRYVLEEFSPEEQAMVEEAIRTAADAVSSLLTNGIEETMNVYNR